MEIPEPGEPTSDDAVYLGDFVTVARMSTVTEATILRNSLAAAGIPAVVGDANFIQADTWMTAAVGGVRVLVPASLVQEAKSQIAELERGAYVLEGEEASTEGKPQATTLELWPPDASAFWSFFLTPAFGAALHLQNSRTLGDHKLLRAARLSMALAVAVTGVVAFMALSAEWSTLGLFRASAIASAYTMLWYIFAAHTQSKYIASAYGRLYKRKSLAKPWLATVLLFVVIGGLGELWHEVG
jgi:hypothetical protein